MVHINLKMAEKTVFQSQKKMGVSKIAARGARHFVPTTPLNLKSWIRLCEDAVSRVHKFWEKCKAGKKEGASLLDGRQWLYFIDSGGQIQFQKLLPAFMPYASVLIVVVSLSKDLSEPASTIMQLLIGRLLLVSIHFLSLKF